MMSRCGAGTRCEGEGAQLQDGKPLRRWRALNSGATNCAPRGLRGRARRIPPPPTPPPAPPPAAPRQTNGRPSSHLLSAGAYADVSRDSREPRGALNRNFFLPSIVPAHRLQWRETERAVLRPVWNFGAWIWRASLATCRLLPAISIRFFFFLGLVSRCVLKFQLSRPTGSLESLPVPHSCVA